MLLPIIYLVGGLVFGTTSGYLIRKQIAQNKAKSIEAKTQKMINDAKTKQQELLLSAKEKSLKIIDEAKKEEQSRRQELRNLQKRLEKRETLFDQRLLDLENKQTKIHNKAQQVENIKKEISKIKEEQVNKLEKIAKLSKDDAQKILLDNVERRSEETLLNRIKKLDSLTTQELEKKATELIAPIIHRCAVDHTVEMSSSVVDLPSEEMKGRIIGREGRNIKTIEQLTGVEIIVDDTPKVITISGFSPIRRDVAKRAIEQLITDGRIQPAKIETAIDEAKKEIALEIKKAGEEAVYELGIAGLEPKLVQIIGRLKYRTSYGQNILKHSIEVAHLSALLAENLGADITIAKKGGLLHDIGKAVDHEIQGTHPEIGRNIAKKFNLSDAVIAPILEHHEDKPSTLEAVLVKTADAISSARLGARKDSYERYLQRLGELENIAKNFEGIDKAYAIQAGREVRVFVNPENISDLQAQKRAEEIAKKIEEELKYPGEIKVTVIRENRIIEYAR